MPGSAAAPSPETIKWLLEPDNPSVRYLTLTGLLGRLADDSEVLEAKRAIMSTGTVPKLLVLQEPGGFWGKPDRFYTDNYGGASWQLILLAELGADGSDPKVRRACEFILDSSQEPKEGGFSMQRAARGGGMARLHS